MHSSSSEYLSLSLWPLLSQILVWFLRTSRKPGFFSWTLSTMKCPPLLRGRQKEGTYLWCLFLKCTYPGLKSVLSSILLAFFFPASSHHSVLVLGKPYCRLRVEFIDKVPSLEDWGLMCWFKCLEQAITVVFKIPFLFSTVDFKISLCFSNFLKMACHKY